MQRLLLIQGCIAGAIVAVMLIFLVTATDFDFQYGELLGYSSMIIAFSTIFFAVKNHRDQELEGQISFGKAFKIGIGITLVASVIYVVTWLILSSTIAKDFMTEYYQFTVEQMQAKGASEAEIAQKTAEMDEFKELYKNPLVKIGITFLEIFPVGLIVSLIAAFILKKKA